MIYHEQVVRRMGIPQMGMMMLAALQFDKIKSKLLTNTNNNYANMELLLSCVYTNSHTQYTASYIMYKTIYI